MLALKHMSKEIAIADMLKPSSRQSASSSVKTVKPKSSLLKFSQDITGKSRIMNAGSMSYINSD